MKEYTTSPKLARQAARRARRGYKRYVPGIVITVVAIALLIVLLGAVWINSAEELAAKIGLSIALSFIPVIILSMSISMMMSGGYDMACGRKNERITVDDRTLCYHYEPDPLRNQQEKNCSSIDIQMPLHNISDVRMNKERCTVTITGDYLLTKTYLSGKAMTIPCRKTELVIAAHFANMDDLLDTVMRAYAENEETNDGDSLRN